MDAQEFVGDTVWKSLQNQLVLVREQLRQAHAEAVDKHFDRPTVQAVVDGGKVLKDLEMKLQERKAMLRGMNDV